MSVYFAHVSGYVKIGYSKNPYQRVATITTKTAIKPDDVTYGDKVDLLGWVPGDRVVEKSMHQKFAHLHVVGEWFWDDDCYEHMLEADPFAAVQWMPGLSAQLMLEHPTIPRERVVEVALAEVDRTRTEAFAGAVGDVLGEREEFDSWEQRAIQVFADEQSKRRRHYRSLHAEKRSQHPGGAA